MDCVGNIILELTKDEATTVIASLIQTKEMIKDVPPFDELMCKLVGINIRREVDNLDRVIGELDCALSELRK